MTEFRIRRATPEDSAVSTSIARQAKASWGYPEHWLREWDSQLQISSDYIRAHPVFVAERDGRVVGVVAVDQGTDGPEIGHLWVSPRDHGRGIGRDLVQRARSLAAQKGWPSLRVVSDPNAQPFYERLGAVPIGRVPAPVAGTDRNLPVLSLPV